MKKRILAIACLLVLPTWADDPPDAAAMQDAFSEVVKKVAPAVVSLDIDLEARQAPKSRLQRLQDRLNRNNPLNAYYQRPEGPVSGVIVDPDGYILTTWFAVNGNVNGIRVTLADGKAVEGKLLGSDQGLDLALVKVEAKGLPHLAPADVSKLRVGEFMLVVGRSPDPAHPTVTTGILSADLRSDGTAVQTDAKIDYGNLGGAAVDLDGRLIGIAAQLPIKEFGLNGGVGYVTRWDSVLKAMPDLKAGKVTTRPPAPFLGVQAAEGAVDVEGAPIEDVVKDSAAERAGLRRQDLILEFQGEKVKEWDDLAKAIKACRPGDEVKLLIRRGDTEMEITAVLGERNMR